MTKPSEKSFEVKDLSAKSRRIGWAVTCLMRVFGVTFRWRVHDPGGIMETPPDHPMVWCVWHNRVFMAPVVYRKFLTSRRGAVMTSPSRDGEIIAATVSRFGCAVVRGSSSRRGASALLSLVDWIRDGYDVLIVPDGPRGPRYRLGPGVVKLTQLTEAKILPIRIEYSSYWKFKSWDQFRLPKPFTTVNVYFDALESAPEDLDDEGFEAERQRIERVMNPAHETD